jgi:hypothetical protein
VSARGERIPARWSRWGMIAKSGHLVDVSEDGEMVIENAEGRTPLDASAAHASRLELQHPDGRWLPHGDVEIIDAYWPVVGRGDA